MFLLGFSLCLAALPLAAFDATGIAALIASLTGAVVATAGLIGSRRRKTNGLADTPTEVTELIRMAQDLERCKAERNELSEKNDDLVAEVLRLNDLTRELGRRRR